MAGDSNLGVWW